MQSDNPSTQQMMAGRIGASQQTVSEVIRKDLGLKRLKKPTAKHLTDANGEQTRKTGERL